MMKGAFKVFMLDGVHSLLLKILVDGPRQKLISLSEHLSASPLIFTRFRMRLSSAQSKKY